MPDQSSTQQLAALQYIARGWRPIPLRGKTPFTEGWQDLRFSASDVPTIWKPGYGIGLILGEGLVDVDLDSMDAVQLAPHFLPRTEAIFGRISKRCSHWLYKIDGDTPYRAFQDPHFDGNMRGLVDDPEDDDVFSLGGAAETRRNRKKPGEPDSSGPNGRGDDREGRSRKTVTNSLSSPQMLLEIRSKGHQTMMPGSIHPTGEPIIWEGEAGILFAREGILPDPTEIPIRDIITGSGRLAACVLLGRHWPGRGIRHIVSMALSGALYRLGWELGEVEDFVEQVCLVAGDDEVVDRLKAVRDTYNNSASRETTGWPTLSDNIGKDVSRLLRSWLSLGLDLRTFPCTDQGNAERLVYYFGENFAYAEDSDVFFVWEGDRWTRDNKSTVKMIEVAVSMHRKVLEEAARESDDDRRKALSKWGAATGNSNKLTAAVKIVKSQPDIKRSTTLFDVDPMLINCSNGTLNLATGGLQPFSREDHITKTTGVPYQKAAQCPLWEKFLDDVFQGRPEVIHYVQKAIGYTLTGLTTEEKIFICYGTGANGKTTLLEAVRAAMGDYASNAAPSTFAAKNTDTIRSDIARLRGSRMVTCSELEADKRLATSMLKYMTGGEAVTARFLFEGEFEFMPTFKPWLASNVKPPLSDSSKGLWRRLVLIPFTVQIERPDRMLKIKLVERELPGILSWAVLGCRMWQEEGLEEPTEIREATLEYQADTDIVGTFLDECCILEGEVLSGALYSSYSSWCSRRGLHVPSNMLLTAKIKDKGFTMIRKTKGKTWQGLSLSAPMFQDAEDDVFGAPVEVS